MARARKKPTSPVPQEPVASPLDHPEAADHAAPANTEEAALYAPDAVEAAAEQLKPMSPERLAAADLAADEIARRSGPGLDHDETEATRRHPEEPRYQHRPRRRSVIGDQAGDARVVLLDEGNHRPLGISMDFATREERPSDAVKRVLREGGFSWDAPKRQWSKWVDRANPVKSRLQAEETFAEAVKQLRHEKVGPGV